VLSLYRGSLADLTKIFPCTRQVAKSTSRLTRFDAFRGYADSMNQQIHPELPHGGTKIRVWAAASPIYNSKQVSPI
jgi:hypothetical protein